MLDVPAVMGMEGKLEVPVRKSVWCKHNVLCPDKILPWIVLAHL